MRSPSFGLASLAMLLLATSPLLRADDDADRTFVQSALDRPILNKGQTLSEVQNFAELRIARMPEVKSADEWSKAADTLRERAFNEVIFRGEARAWRDAKGRVEWFDSFEKGPGYHIRKLRYEAVPGVWIPALLYEPDAFPPGAKVPVVLNVNGHDGKGKAADYKQVRCINLAKRGILALNLEWIGMGQLSTAGFAHDRINALDLCGTSGIAAHFLAMKRGIDILLDQPNADPARVAVTGLSGGGWQTIFFSPLEPRVTLAVPVAGYSSFLTRIRHFSDLGDPEQTPSDLATVLDYAHLTAMLAPRPAMLTFNQKDNCCFAAPHAMPPLVAAAAPIYSLFGQETNFRLHVNIDPGDHNYGLDNRQAFYRMLADHWYRGDSSFSPVEIPSDSEVKTADQLDVPLPIDNLDLHKLALAIAEKLPRTPERPSDPAALPAWTESRRKALRDLVRPIEGDVQAEQVSTETRDGLTATSWRLRIGGAWTVPAVELTRGTSDRVTLVLADAGRKSAAIRGLNRLATGDRVLVVDPFYFGEAADLERNYLWPLIVSTVGSRPLGLQVGQLAAISAWLRKDGKAAHITLDTTGPRTGVVARCAHALSSDIDAVELHEALKSLKDVLTRPLSYAAAPELFCFGLLEQFDLDTIAALRE